MSTIRGGAEQLAEVLPLFISRRPPFCGRSPSGGIAAQHLAFASTVCPLDPVGDDVQHPPCVSSM